METDRNIDMEIDNPHETRDRFVKLLLGTAAGFIAGRMVENLYDNVVTKRRMNRLYNV